MSLTSVVHHNLSSLVKRFDRDGKHDQFEVPIDSCRHAMGRTSPSRRTPNGATMCQTAVSANCLSISMHMSGNGSQINDPCCNKLPFSPNFPTRPSALLFYLSFASLRGGKVCTYGHLSIFQVSFVPGFKGPPHAQVRSADHPTQRTHPLCHWQSASLPPQRAWPDGRARGRVGSGRGPDGGAAQVVREVLQAAARLEAQPLIGDRQVHLAPRQPVHAALHLAAPGPTTESV